MRLGSRRLRLLEDRFEIQDLAARYFMALDGRDFAALESLFSADASFEETIGRDNILVRLRGRRGELGRTSHTPDYTLVKIGRRGTAEGIVGAHCEVERDGERLEGTMRYYDTYARENGAWKFSSRRVEWLEPLH